MFLVLALFLISGMAACLDQADCRLVTLTPAIQNHDEPLSSIVLYQASNAHSHGASCENPARIDFHSQAGNTSAAEIPVGVYEELRLMFDSKIIRISTHLHIDESNPLVLDFSSPAPLMFLGNEALDIREIEEHGAPNGLRPFALEKTWTAPFQTQEFQFRVNSSWNQGFHMGLLLWPQERGHPQDLGFATAWLVNPDGQTIFNKTVDRRNDRGEFSIAPAAVGAWSLHVLGDSIAPNSQFSIGATFVY